VAANIPGIQFQFIFKNPVNKGPVAVLSIINNAETENSVETGSFLLKILKPPKQNLR
jgi:hypothetical protein